MNSEERYCPECPQSYMNGFNKGQEMGMKVAQDVLHTSTKPMKIEIPPGQHLMDNVLGITEPDGWVISHPGRENLAFALKATAISEGKRLGHGTIRPIIYLNRGEKID